MSNLVVELISAGPNALAKALACDLTSLEPAQVVEATRVAQAIRRNADALVCALLTEGERQEAHRATGEISMTSLVAREAGISRREAGQQVRLARQLQQAPVLRDSLSRPGMSTDKAKLVTDALEKLPADLSAAERHEVERDLTMSAPDLPLEELRRKTARAVEIIDAGRADRIENRETERSEQQQAKQVTFWMSQADPATGMVKGGFEVDALTGDILRSFLDSATAPRKNAATDGPAAEPTRVDRPRAQGRAFVELVRHLPKDCFGNHGGVPATLIVTVDEAALRRETDRAGVTEHGTVLSAGQLRKLACDADILPAVMGGASEVLDLGRRDRFHSVAQRRALALRDLGCAFPGCDRPPGWCESHHLVPWGRGGETTVNDGVLLCSRHHHEVHDRGWQLQLNPIENQVEFRRRPGEAWQRNHRYRPRKSQLPIPCLA
ncbi:MAG TPA: DUF222 domain-containing protein [Aeromicrobium sp.]|nr:DUF222 domain-containing protein [Aeromicrobium sp.]